jgi:hypothetical protein
MDRLAAMDAFVRVIESDSFSGVVKQLHLGQPAVSKTIAQLEEPLLRTSDDHARGTNAAARVHDLAGDSCPARLVGRGDGRRCCWARRSAARRSRSSAVRTRASHIQSLPACAALMRCQAANSSSLSITSIVKVMEFFLPLRVPRLRFGNRRSPIAAYGSRSRLRALRGTVHHHHGKSASPNRPPSVLPPDGQGIAPHG